MEEGGQNVVLVGGDVQDQDRRGERQDDAQDVVVPVGPGPGLPDNGVYHRGETPVGKQRNQEAEPVSRRQQESVGQQELVVPGEVGKPEVPAMDGRNGVGPAIFYRLGKW